jgi:hypothetical protein
MAKTPAERQKIYRMRKAGLIPPVEAKQTPLERNRKWKYGVSRADYNRMIKEQGGKCYICNSVPKGHFHIDHNHENGATRALLCPSCNILIGLARENINILENAINYLKMHNLRHDI